MTKHNTPALRFDGFDGEWETKEFGSVVTRSSTASAEPALPRLEYEDIVSGVGGLNKDLSRKESLKAGLLFGPGDVLYGKLRPYLKNWLLPDFSGIAVGDFWVLQSLTADPKFLYQLIQTPMYAAVTSISSGSKMPRADWKLVSQAPTAFPPTLEEQRAIGELFVDLDALIEQHRAKHANLQQTKTALLQRMFPQDGADEPELRLGGFSGAWEMVSFDSLLTRVEIGTNILGSNRYHGIPLLKMGNIRRGYFDFSSFERLPDNAELPSCSLVRTGDFLFNTRNTMELVGKGATWMGESGAFAFNGNIARFTLERVDTKFFNYLYNHPRSIRDVSKCATGTTSVAAIYPRSLKSVQFQIPALEEQRAIGEVFSNLDALIAAESRYITQLTQAKTALLQRMFV
ncbi:restriction endonuclease subunit S [Corynebacterium macginleyi]|uniref:restriction endonuclease subunit S n=1 Tax=Corynebacterium macginleyi TaxID=38290 RepID=UPI00190CCCAC|nr:restriction endonuclease subunit S [Corynebacterium macginleyi]